MVESLQQANDASDHNFALKKFVMNRWCSQCSCYIWAFQKAFICKECDLPFHSLCKPTQKCSKKPIRDTKKQITSTQTVPRDENIKKTTSISKCLLGLADKGSKFAKHYNQKHRIFKNSHITVYKAVEKETKDPVVVKTLKFTGKIDTIAKQQLQKIHEIKHRLLVPVKEVFVENKFFVITSEPSTGDPFFKPLRDRDYITEENVRGLITDILIGLKHLHQNNVIHGMLRPEFIFINPDDLSVQLSEYGLWKILGCNILCAEQSSKMFLAPEMLQNLGFGRGIDMWCVGVITYLLLSGTPPFYGHSQDVLVESIITADFDYPPECGWDSVSDNAIDFIDSLLVTKPSKRLNVSQALDHPFINTSQENIFNVLENVPEQLDDMMNLYQSSLQTSIP